jgi:hypothetical protein
VFRHQIITTAMAAGGDSGSLLMNGDLEAVGLLFAGSAMVTIHSHISDVEAALGVRPLSRSPVVVRGKGWMTSYSIRHLRE